MARTTQEVFDHHEAAFQSGDMAELADYAGAKEAYERAIKIGEAAFGPDHPRCRSLLTKFGKPQLCKDS